MAIRFSQVTVEADGSEDRFLVNGIPEDCDAPENWTAFRSLVHNLDGDTTVHIHADTFLYGDGEVFDAILPWRSCGKNMVWSQRNGKHRMLFLLA